MIAVLILIPAVAFIAILLGVYAMAFYSRQRGRKENIYDIPSSPQYQPQKERMRRIIGELDAIPCKRVQITSRDGLTLSARYYHTRDGAPLVIMAHGYRGSAIRDFCGGARISLDLGHNVLLLDQRANGASGGRTITFGIRERYDVLDWIDYARRQFGKDIPMALYGVSMGAATVLMVAGMEELPKNVRGVAADCPYSSPEEIIRKVAVQDLHLPERPAMFFVRLAARWIGRFSIRDGSPVEAVRRAKIPMLIIHGEDDRFVPCGMSREIRDANPALVQLETFPGAGHGLSYIVDTRRYTRAVIDFEKKILR